MNKRTLQEIFGAVIDGGYYFRRDIASQYMCHALKSACEEGAIAEEELQRANQSIKAYMIKLNPCLISIKACTLSICLYDAGITKHVRANENKAMLLAIYRDWTNRPYRSKSARNSRRRELYAIQKAAKEATK